MLKISLFITYQLNCNAMRPRLAKENCWLILEKKATVITYIQVVFHSNYRTVNRSSYLDQLGDIVDHK